MSDSGFSPRESADNYRGELHRLGRWRVAQGRDRLQFLLQRQRPGKAGVGAAWDSVSYCVTQKALLQLWRLETGDQGHALTRPPDRAPLLRFEEWRRQEVEQLT